MLTGRILETVAGFGLALGDFPVGVLPPCLPFWPATFVSHSFWLAAGTPHFQAQLINFCKDMAIWGGLVFIAGTTNQPSLLTRSRVRSTSSVSLGEWERS
jgi:hypothetical protein